MHWMQQKMKLTPGNSRPLCLRAGTDTRGFHTARARGYTSRMDAVRFGRALGFGARQAVKTVTAVVDAATAEKPSAPSASKGVKAGDAATRPQEPPATQSTQSATSKATSKVAHQAAQTINQVRGASAGMRRGGRRFGGTTWGTFKRLGGVLWLEVSGVFFGLFALFALVAVVHLRGEWHRNAAGHRPLVVAVAMLAFFGYFCVSNFVHAKRRERRH